MKKKLKIIHLAHASHSYFVNEKDNLKKIILNDWYSKTSKQLKKFYPEIDIECWAPEKIDKIQKSFVEEGILFRFFPTTFSPLYALDFSIQMLKELKKETKKSKENGYELIIHLHEYHNLHGLIISTFFNNQKIVAQHHGGSWPLKHLKESSEKKKFFIFFWLAQLWENLSLKKINYFYVLSKDELNYLKKTASKSKIRFQTMGIEEIYFKSINKRIARKKLKIPLNEKTILFLGRVGKIKGVDFLINVMESLPEVNLKIIGYGQEREELEKYAKQKGLKNIEFLGGVFGDRKLLYLSAADALILPSLKEGAPVTIMEAMAKNLPSIVTNVGGTSLMIKKGQNGIIVERDLKKMIKAIQEVLNWKKKDLKKYAKIYKWEKIIENTVKDYLN